MLSNPEIRAIIFYYTVLQRRSSEFPCSWENKIFIFFISIPVMYMIDNVSSEKILIQFINLFID